MKKITLSVLASFFWLFSFSQVDINRLFEKSPELIIKFQVWDKSQLEQLTRMVSIDNVKGNEVIAYTTQEEFEQFLTLNIPYEVVEKPVLTPEELNMLDFEAIKNCRNDWNYYPNYDAYIDMMNEFAASYPDLCRVVEFGTSVQNRKLLACVVSKNVQVREAEPQILWSSSMHGDELTGYVLTLRYIDYLLSNYGTNERVTWLLDNMEIWINPLANPDGTFWTGNSSVSGARRGNAYNRDLNRNYKDWKYGDHPDGYAWQKETLLFMDLQDAETFVLSANLHGGAEVFNFTWDNTCSLPADYEWWKLVSKEYVDTARSVYNNYFNDNYCDYCNPPWCYPGVCNGASWYSITGSRQDYANYYNHTREVCLEISNTKTPAASQLPNFWDRNYRSFLNYTQQATYGIQGVVTNACSGEPLHAKVFINGHDVDNSFVMTDPRVGYYARLIRGGTYSLTYSADGYEPQTVSVTVADKERVIQNISLYATGSIFPVANFEADVTEIFINETIQFNDLSEDATAWEWYFEGGTPETSTEQNPEILYKNPGNFGVKLKVLGGGGCSDERFLDNYITVKQTATSPIANFEADKTEILEKETVKFKDLSENVTGWLWKFEGGAPETSEEQNPAVIYENQGIYSVKLTVTNDLGSDEMLKANYIVVNELAINEWEGAKVKIFPNPAKTTITIDAESPIYKIELINLMGAIVKKTCPAANPYIFSVSGIEKGIYLMRVETQKGGYMTKIQVQ